MPCCSHKALVRPLEGKVALVTGASRGIGKGIALQLGQAGARVYITGRKPENSLKADYKQLPTLEATAQEVRDRGGECFALYCDHSKPEEVKELFERVARENEQVLDILVNNAFSAVHALSEAAGRPFYELDPLFWDEVNNVGLRNNYICSVYAARLMAKRKSGLIVQISSIGGIQYLFNVAYGVGKSAIDRMAADMAQELKDTGVTVVSLWPGSVKTEMSYTLVPSGKVAKVMNKPQEQVERALNDGESIEYPGKAIVYLAADPKKAKMNGKIVLACDLACKYGFKDIDGRDPLNMRSVKTALEFFGWNRLAKVVPGCLKIPHWGMHFVAYKF